MTIKTLEQALSLVPEFFMLVPGVDRVKSGDEFGEGHARTRWTCVDDRLGLIGGTVDNLVHRRPIPENVRRSEAIYILWDEASVYVERPEYDRGELYRWISENRDDKKAKEQTP